ncbi:MAG: TraX family protein [Bacilli bacterium]|jgi:hypothetical protein
MEKKEANKGISIYVIKIIALISMTFDHVGFFMMNSYTFDNSYIIGYVLRFVGRLSLPLFIFALIEGLKHTSNIKRHILMLGIEAIGIYAIMLILQSVTNFDFGLQGNIFISLFLFALSYYFLFYAKHKWLVVFPIIYIVISFGLKLMLSFDVIDLKSFVALPYINGLLLQYDIISSLLFFGPLIGYKLYDNQIKKRLVSQDNIDAFSSTNDYQRSKNGIVCIIIAFIALICYLITYLPLYEEGLNELIDGGLQSAMLFACIVIYFYNGKKGHTSKLSKYGFYLYYPIHVAIIYFVFYLIFGY